MKEDTPELPGAHTTECLAEVGGALLGAEESGDPRLHPLLRGEPWVHFISSVALNSAGLHGRSGAPDFSWTPSCSHQSATENQASSSHVLPHVGS